MMTNEESKRPKFDTSKWQDRLCIEYYQLSDRIDKLERAIVNWKYVSKDQSAYSLMQTQRSAMLDYKDALFRRICHYGIRLYSDMALDADNLEGLAAREAQP